MELNKKTKILIVALIVGLVSCLISGALALHYIYATGTPSTSNVSALPTITVSNNGTTAFIGDTIKITATISQPLNGIVVTFFDNITDITPNNLGNVVSVNGVSNLLVTATTVSFHNWNVTATLP